MEKDREVRFRAVMHAHGIHDTRGVELLRAVRLVNNLYDMVFSEQLRDDRLSGARWGLLMRLYAEEASGNHDGISPSVLSQHQQVSKNTISSLLRGLEEHGFIERRLDAHDRRAFTIRLTDAGRSQVREKAPARIAFLNRLVADLTPEESDTLLELLAKLRESLAKESSLADCNPSNDAAPDALSLNGSYEEEKTGENKTR